MGIYSRNNKDKEFEKTMTVTLIVFAVISITLMVFQPSIGFIDSELTTTFGAVMFGGTAIMSGPLFHRFAENIRKDKESNKE